MHIFQVSSTFASKENGEKYILCYVSFLKLLKKKKRENIPENNILFSVLLKMPKINKYNLN